MTFSLFAAEGPSAGGANWALQPAQPLQSKYLDRLAAFSWSAWGFFFARQGYDTSL